VALWPTVTPISQSANVAARNPATAKVTNGSAAACCSPSTSAWAPAGSGRAGAHDALREADRLGGTAPAEDYLRESGSDYTLPAMIAALGGLINQLTWAMCDAVLHIDPPRSARPGPSSSDPHQPRAHRKVASKIRCK
jgi:hypothetical protein